MTQQTNPTAQTSLKISKNYVHQCFSAITIYINQEEAKAPRGKEAQKAFEHVREMLRYLESEVNSITEAATLMATLDALKVSKAKNLSKED